MEKFSEHLKTITPEDWEKLFSLLPQIENSKKFGEERDGTIHDGALTFPFWVPYAIVDKTFNIISKLDICPIFDWTSWEEGETILTTKDFDYSKIDTITLCKLLTTIIRADRFNDGFLICCFEDGIMTQIIKGLKNNVQNKKDPFLF